MSEHHAPPRPAPPRSIVDRLRAWTAWVGLTRLVLAAVSVLIVAGGAAWLVRPGDLPVEQGLPPSSGAPPTATLPPPATAEPVSTPASSPAADGAPLFVHVAGAVVAPGVHRVPAGARVVDAIDAAGGPAPTGDLDALNLAADVVDGQRVYVPEVGEVDPATVPSGGSADGSDTETSPPTGPLDLNHATAVDLEALPGVGPATAAAIVDDRERNGPFAAVDDLDRVPGIGPAKLAALRDLVTV